MAAILTMSKIDTTMSYWKGKPFSKSGLVETPRSRKIREEISIQELELKLASMGIEGINHKCLKSRNLHQEMKAQKLGGKLKYR